MVENKKILHVVNISFVLPYFIGNQFDYFLNKGYSFFVACQPSEHLYNYSKKKRFNVIEVNIDRKVSLIKDIWDVYVLYKFIKKEKVNIVVGHTPKGGIISMLAAYLAGVNHRIYFRHGIMYETSKGIKRVLFKFIEKASGFLATKVVCVSKSVLNVGIKDNLNNLSKSVLLNQGTCNGIDSEEHFNPFIVKNTDEVLKIKERLGIQPSDIVVGYVGRLVKDKGINELVDAWQILTKKYPNLKLLLVGPFEERDGLCEETKLLIEKNTTIINTGIVDDAAAYYSLMHIFILPSYREGFPTVVLEASSMELPVLTSRATGCIDSIKEGITGKFMDIQPDSIASCLTFYINNLDIAKQHGINGRKFVTDNFEQTLIWKELNDKVYNTNT